MNGYRDKTVAITGGAGGIGFALAKAFAAEGARIALIDLSAERIQERIEELRASEATAEGYACNIVDPDAAGETLNAVIERFGGVDVLIHCAGLTQVGPFERNDLDVYRRTMDVNFFGAVHCTKAALDLLIARQGQIIVLSSIAGFAPLLGRTGYCASKHALHGFFDTLRCELSDRGVGVTIVCPSFVATDFAKTGLGPDGKPLTFDRSTTGETTSPEAVAAAIVDAARKRKRLLVISRTGKLAYWLSRLVPGYYARGMTKRFKIEMDR